MGHIVPCLHFIDRENIFSSCVSSTQFFFFFKKKTWFVSFYLSPPLLFFPKTVFPKTCFVFPIFIGGEIFLTFVVLRGSCCSSEGELSLFSLTLLHMFSVYLLIRQTFSICDKKGETQMNCLFWLGKNIKNFLLYLTQGESQFIFLYSVLELVYFFIFYFILFFRRKAHFRPYIFTRFPLCSLYFIFTAFSPYLEKRILFQSFPSVPLGH